VRRAELTLAFSILLATGAAMADTCPALLDRTVPGLLDGKPKSLCQYSGRVLLVVNTASRCGFTRQYEGLEKLQDRFGRRGLTVLGFPSNDFGNQEPGSDKDIAQFCSMTYGVKFPMFSKTSVTGSGRHPLYADLSRISGVEPGWNFHKYLVARDGSTIASFPSNIAPESAELIAAIEAALGK
jgi:glutathione peroxidase